MSHFKNSVFFLIFLTGLFFTYFASASPLSNSVSQYHNDIKRGIIPVHNWEELEEQRSQGAFGPEKRLRKFRRDGGGWRDFKRKHEREIRRFQRNKGRHLSFEKSAYLYYNYNFGYITDNCQFIKGPVRFCWFENSGKRQCEWRRKWIYSCY
ncbi:MAG: hypothetical protein ACRBBN_13175 [Methyloligellaceae bacterium]